MSKGNILGNFYLTDKLGADEFGKEDEDLIVGLAAFAAVAIENAKLYTETDTQLKRKVDEVEKASHQLRFLVDLSALLPSGPIAEKLPLEDVLARATALLGDACGVYLVAPDGEVTRKLLVHRIPSRAGAAQALVDSSWDTMYDQVVKKGKSIFIADVETIPAPFATFRGEEMKERKYTAAMALPIRSAKQVYGVFVSLASQPVRFTQEDLSFGMLVAQRLGTAIGNAYLLRDLSDAVKTRDEFISVATHELKTPVSVLVGYADVAIKAMQADPEQASLALRTIKKQSMRLSALTDELLDVARIKAGRLELHREGLSLSTFVQDAIERFKAQLAPEDRQRLKLFLTAADLHGEWDPLRLEQVLVNLLSNAFKYSPNGGDVEVRVDRLDHMARVSVADQGTGIPQDQQARIFEPFFRATTAGQAKAAGAGLGLHISKEIVEWHGGQMWFKSEEGKGSTFYFTLPLSD